MLFTIAFLNCENLFLPGGCKSRFSGDEAEFGGKIQALADTLRDAVGGAIPDIFGLCELGSEEAGSRLVNLVSSGSHSYIWSGQPKRVDQTGLLLAYNRQHFAAGRPVNDGGLRGDEARSKWMSVRLSCLVGREIPIGPIWITVNHWNKNQEGTGTENSHSNLWNDFGRFYRQESIQDAIPLVTIGDFNCEPWAKHFMEQTGVALEPTRQRELVTRELRNNSFLYNPMWRLLGEADPHEVVVQSMDDSRPVGTFREDTGKPWKMWDQMFVNKALLTGPDYRLQESSLKISRPHQYDGKQPCSKHCALGVAIQLLGV